MKVSPEALRERILRSLGAPIVQPNITVNQLDQAIDDAIKLYTEFHFNGTHKDYIIIRADRENVGGMSTFQLPDTVVAITKILKSGKGFPMKGIATTDGATDTWFTAMFQGGYGAIAGGGGCSMGLSNLNGMLPLFTILDSNIRMWSNQINPEIEFIFDSANKTLAVMDAKIVEGSIIICEAYVATTLGMFQGGNGANVGGSAPTNYVDSLYDLHNYSHTSEHFHNPMTINNYVGGTSVAQGGLDERWVIEYATAQAKYIWGMNLTYVSGVSQSNGGVKIDGYTLKEEAQVEKNRLKEEVRGMGNQPMMLIG